VYLPRLKLSGPGMKGIKISGPCLVIVYGKQSG
jgi:hypothetical protein